MDKTVYLSITSFIGISIGARHFYGELKQIDPERITIDLKKILTKKEAIELNREMTGYSWDVFEEGNTYRGFNTKQEIIDLAIKTYKEHFPDASRLVLGHSYNVEEDLKVLHQV